MRNQLSQLNRSSNTSSSSSITSGNNNNIVTVTREITNKKRRVGLIGNGGDTVENMIIDGDSLSSSPNQGTSSVKISLMFNEINDIFRYERRASIDHKKFIFNLYDENKAERTRNFFINDQLEDETPYLSVPSDFKLYQNLKKANWEKYQAREESMRDAASLVPKPDLEEVNREYIKLFRLRPKKGQELCSQGTRCYFYTFSSDPEVRYIGQVFRTQRQQYEYEKTRADLITKNVDNNHLCIDCLLARWTKECMDNIAKERSQKLPINHFTVIVGEGEYNAGCMLPVVFNKLVTGIVGCIPEYDAKKRTVETISHRRLGEVVLTTEKYIGEIGMDF
jgi:hypothetical protein